MSGPIAIIGANGFIGGRIVEMAHLGQWAEVRPVVRRPRALAHARRFDVQGRIADATDEEALRRAFDGCEGVIHAVAGDPPTILGTLDPVYRAAEAAGVRRLVYLSSASVHGQSPASGTDESSPLSDRQPLAYNNAKVRAERRLLALRRQGRTELVILRPGIVHGPRSPWIAGFADELLLGAAYLVDGGHGTCNSVYVDNLVHAIRLALTVPAADGRAYLIGDAEEITWVELYRPVADALGYDLDRLPNPVPGERKLALRERLRSPRFRRFLGTLPIPVREGLKASYAAWQRGRAGSPPEGAIAPEVTLERAMLHRCRYKLPWTLAQRELGYVPSVRFRDASARSVAWLAFAGYPVVANPAEENRGGRTTSPGGSTDPVRHGDAMREVT